MKFRVAVQVLPRRGILDPQGKAVGDALRTLGFAGVTDVHVGRHLVIDTSADSADAAKAAVKSMCDRLLANPVTEDFIIAGVEAA
jgi:phosphoribosylformylglycinamidine synthase PurS subunit